MWQFEVISDYFQLCKYIFCYCKTFRTRFQSDLSEKYYVTQKNITYFFKGLLLLFSQGENVCFHLWHFVFLYVAILEMKKQMEE